jgi:hypothetical protein
MSIWYVHRREDGVIASAHQDMQPDYATEALDDASGELADWFAKVNTPPPAPTPAEKLAAAGLTVDDLKTLLGFSSAAPVQNP